METGGLFKITISATPVDETEDYNEAIDDGAEDK
jgi:hypothetical protein